MATAIQVKRVGPPTGYNTWGMEQGFVNASVVRFPKVGDYLTFGFDRLGKGQWMTTIVREIKTQPGVKIFITKNAEYHVKKGWAK